MIRFAKSIGYATKGIAKAIKDERNIQVQLVMAMGAIVLGLVVGISRFEWIAIILCIGFVLVGELMNTAIENLVDGISPEKSDWAGNVKDIAAGAVLVASIISTIIAILIFTPYFF
jgi:diacylglycerol kinase (ATP)